MKEGGDEVRKKKFKYGMRKKKQISKEMDKKKKKKNGKQMKNAIQEIDEEKFKIAKKKLFF